MKQNVLIKASAAVTTGTFRQKVNLKFRAEKITIKQVRLGHASQELVYCRCPQLNGDILFISLSNVESATSFPELPNDEHDIIGGFQSGDLEFTFYNLDDTINLDITTAAIMLEFN